jgi:hypothetical protein
VKTRKLSTKIPFSGLFSGRNTYKYKIQAGCWMLNAMSINKEYEY